MGMKYIIHTPFNEILLAAADTRAQAEQWIADNRKAAEVGENTEIIITTVVGCDEPYRYIGFVTSES
jgi:hypothetical protein